ncbi:thiamine pyrophosphate-dependent enzyme [Streptomyces jeddahensis]|uniref:thiamine pyrophosphate-dependent enzyme n=1 Tax=Streptomyces jeddahensis TaxID=1716141 RepID=UPI00098E8866
MSLGAGPPVNGTPPNATGTSPPPRRLLPGAPGPRSPAARRGRRRGHHIGPVAPPPSAAPAAEPGRPVVAVLGDGSSLFGLQGPWSAARRNARTLLVAMVNGPTALSRRPTRHRTGGSSASPGRPASSASTRSARTAPATCRNWSRAQADEPFGTGRVFPSGSSSRGSIPLGEYLEEQIGAVPAGLQRTGLLTCDIDRDTKYQVLNN